MKSYNTIQDAENELQRIVTCVRPFIPVEASIVSTRGRKPATVSRKVGTSNKSKLHQSVTTLEKLREQTKVLDNLIANINAQFRSDDDPNVQKILNNAAKLKAVIEKQLKAESNSSHERTEQHISPEVKQLAKQIKAHYHKVLNVDSDITYQDGLKDGKHIMCAYITLKNVKNFSNEVTPENIIALTEIDHTFFIHPGLTKIVAPGQFNKGFEITTRNEAINYINAQLEADSNISAIAGKPVPIKPEHFSSTKAKNIQFKDNYISVSLPDKIKTPEMATEAANDLYRDLQHTVLSIDPKNRDKIKWMMKKGSKNYIIQFKFASGSSAHGRTLSREEHKTLLEVFTPDEIKKIRRSLAE